MGWHFDMEGEVGVGSKDLQVNYVDEVGGGFL